MPQLRWDKNKKDVVLINKENKIYNNVTKVKAEEHLDNNTIQQNVPTKLITSQDTMSKTVRRTPTRGRPPIKKSQN
jgi:hypothetical protein